MVRVREESSSSTGGGNNNEKQKRASSGGGSSPKKDATADTSGETTPAAAAASPSPVKESNNNDKSGDRLRNGSPSPPAGEVSRSSERTVTTSSGGGSREERHPPSSRNYYSSHKKYLPYKSYQSGAPWSQRHGAGGGGGPHHHHQQHHSQHHHSNQHYGEYGAGGGGGYDVGEPVGASSWGAASPYGGSYPYTQAPATYYDLTGANGGGGGYYGPTGGVGSGGSYYGYGHHSRRRGGGSGGRGRTFHSSRSTRQQAHSPNSHHGGSGTHDEPYDDSSQHSTGTLTVVSSSGPAGGTSPTNVTIVLPMIGGGGTGDRSPSVNSVSSSSAGNNANSQSYYHQHQQHQHQHQHHQSTVTVEEVSDDVLGGSTDVIMTPVSVSMMDDASLAAATCAAAVAALPAGGTMTMTVPAGASVMATTSASVVSPAATVEAMGACGILTPLTAPNGAVGQIVHLHIGLGEAMQFQVGDQVQLVSAAFGWFCSSQEPDACELCVPPIFLGYFMLPDQEGDAGGHAVDPANDGGAVTGDRHLQHQQEEAHQQYFHHLQQQEEEQQQQHQLLHQSMVVTDEDLAAAVAAGGGIIGEVDPSTGMADVTMVAGDGGLVDYAEDAEPGPATVRMPVPMQMSTGPMVVDENGAYRQFYLSGVPAQAMMQIPANPYGASSNQATGLGQTYYQFAGSPQASTAAHFATQYVSPPAPPPAAMPPLQATTGAQSAPTAAMLGNSVASNSSASPGTNNGPGVTTVVDAGTTTMDMVMVPGGDGSPDGCSASSPSHSPQIADMTEATMVGPNGRQSSPVHHHHHQTPPARGHYYQPHHVMHAGSPPFGKDDRTRKQSQKLKQKVLQRKIIQETMYQQHQDPYQHHQMQHSQQQQQQQAAQHHQSPGPGPGHYQYPPFGSAYDSHQLRQGLPRKDNNRSGKFGERNTAYAGTATASAAAVSANASGQTEWEEERELVDILSTIRPPLVSQLESRSAMVAWMLPTALTELLEYVASTAAEEGENDEEEDGERDGDDEEDEDDDDGVEDVNNEDDGGAENGRGNDEDDHQSPGHSPKRSDERKKRKPTRRLKRRKGPSSNTDAAVVSCRFSKEILDLAHVMEERELNYDVLLSDKGRDMRHFKSIYFGGARDCKLTDLKPATEYHICVQAVYEDIRGRLSDAVHFCTLACEPDTPHPPKLTQKTKNSLQLKWNPPGDNGAKLLKYVLESGEGHAGPFAIVYEGLNKTCRLTKLQAATTHRVRLAAVNRYGASGWSEVVHMSTSGSPPPPPSPPSCVDAGVSSLSLTWAKRQVDDTFVLQMEELGSPHGFIPQYNGRDTSFRATKLKRNTVYRFRLLACNDEGVSSPSEPVEGRTLCDAPGRPGAPRVKGKILTHSFRLVWDAPSNDGGCPPTSYQLELDSGSGFAVVYTGPDAENVCDRLAPGTTHRARVKCHGRGGASDYSDVASVATLAVAPGTCVPPRVVGKPKANSLCLKWSPPETDGGSPVTDYEVDVTCPDNTTVTAYRGRETECVVANLLPGTPYLFQVRAVTKAGVGPWSEPMEVVSGAGPPDKPRKPCLTAKSSTVIAVEWEEPLNNGAAVTQYKLEMASHQPPPSSTLSIPESLPSSASSASSFAASDKDVNPAGPNDETCILGCTDGTSGLVFSAVYVGPLLSYDVRSLQPAGTYSFRVQASNSAGTSQFSSPTCITLPASVPGPISSVACRPHPVTGDMSTCVHVTWGSASSNGSPIASWVIEATPSSSSGSPSNNGDGKVSTTVTDPRSDNGVLFGLQPETQYKVRVQAVNGVGAGPFSSACRVTTRPLPPGAPRLELFSSSHNSLKLKWTDVSAAATTNSSAAGSNRHHHAHHHHHMRSVSPASSSSSLVSGVGSAFPVTYVLEMENPKHEGRFFQAFSGSSLTHKVQKLTEASRYRFRINAKNESGPGAYSPVYEFWTTKAPPHSIKAPKVTQSGSGAACVIEWQPVKPVPGQDAISYRVQMSKSGTSEPTEVYSGKDASFTYKDVGQSDRELSFRVCAVREPAPSSPAANAGNENSNGSGNLRRRRRTRRPSNGSDGGSNRSDYDDDEDEEDNSAGVSSGDDDDGDNDGNRRRRREVVVPPPHIAATVVYGPWSQWTAYRPPHTAPHSASNAAGNGQAKDGSGEGANVADQPVVERQWTDNQWALVFVFCLTLIAVFLSFVINYAMSDGNPTADATGAGDAAAAYGDAFKEAVDDAAADDAFDYHHRHVQEDYDYGARYPR